MDSVHGSWTSAGVAGPRVHRGLTVARTEGTAARSPELGLRPLRSMEAHRRGCNSERGTRAAVWRPGDGEETATGREVSNRGARASGEGESELGRCGEVWGGARLL
jgi:hypothetical protein